MSEVNAIYRNIVYRFAFALGILILNTDVLAAHQVNHSTTNNDRVIFANGEELVYLDDSDNDATLLTKRNGNLVASKFLSWSPTHADKIKDGYIIAKVRVNNPGLAMDKTRMQVHLANGQVWKPEFNPGDYVVSANGKSIAVIEENKGDFYSSLYTREGVLVGRVPIPKQFGQLHGSSNFKPSVSGDVIIEAPVPSIVSAYKVTVYEGPKLSKTRKISLQDPSTMQNVLIKDAIAIDASNIVLLSQGRIFGFGRYGANWVGVTHPLAGGFTRIEVSPSGEYILGMAEATGAFYVFDSISGDVILKRDYTFSHIGAKGLQGNIKHGKGDVKFSGEKTMPGYSKHINSVLSDKWQFLDKAYPLYPLEKKERSVFYREFNVAIHFDDNSRLLFTVPGKNEINYYVIDLNNENKIVETLSVPKEKAVFKNDGKLFVVDSEKATQLSFVKLETAQ